MSDVAPTGEVPRGCAIRIIAVFMITAISLAWYAMSVERRSTEELKRCVQEATSAAQESAARADDISETLDGLAAGRIQVAPALQRLEDLRSASTSMATVLRSSGQAGLCSTESSPVLRLLEIEERARAIAAESATLLIRSEQAFRESKRYAAEAADYRRRYASLGQKHLLTLAEDFKERSQAASRRADRLRQSFEVTRGEMNSALREHERVLRAII